LRWLLRLVETAEIYLSEILVIGFIVAFGIIQDLSDILLKELPIGFGGVLKNESRNLQVVIQ
jgi:hypothetical protein